MDGEYLLPLLMNRSTREDILTEALAYVLRNSTSFRQTMAEKIWGKYEAMEHIEIETQRVIKDRKRVDILWKESSDQNERKRECIFESKIDADWSNGQPQCYLEDLQKDLQADGAFVLIAPSFRVEELFKKAFSDHSDACDSKNGSVWIRRFSWRQVGDWIKDSVPNEINPRTKMHMEEVIEMINTIDPQFKSQSPDREAIKKSAETLFDLCLLLKSIHADLQHDGIEGKIQPVQSSSSEKYGWWYGFYYSTAENLKFFFGIWSDAWIKTPEKPFSLSPSTSQMKDECEWIKNLKGSETVRDIPFFPVALSGETWADVQKNVIKDLKELLSRFSKASGI